MLVRILSFLLSVVESFFPLLPVNKVSGDADWQHSYRYYFLDDPSLRLQQRLEAILSLDTNAISFWRRRTALLVVMAKLQKLAPDCVYSLSDAAEKDYQQDCYDLAYAELSQAQSFYANPEKWF